MFGLGGAKTGKVDTMVGQGTEIKGNLNIKGSIYVDGRVEGNIATDDGIMLGEAGSVKGNLAARNIIIGGRVHGHVVASERVELLSTSVVDGDIRSPRLLIAEGSVFEGSCEMENVEAPAITEKGKKK